MERTLIIFHICCVSYNAFMTYARPPSACGYLPTAYKHILTPLNRSQVGTIRYYINSVPLGYCDIN